MHENYMSGPTLAGTPIAIQAAKCLVTTELGPYNYLTTIVTPAI
jgi:hypothetical protein